MTSWYSDWFNKDYLDLYPHRDQNEAFKAVNFSLGHLKLNTSAKILDVACGAGRHVYEFAKLGFNITGCDLSVDLLNQAKIKLEKHNLKATLIKADMRKMPFLPESFDLLTSYFTSFGYFDTDKEHLNLLKHWGSLIKKEGNIIIDYFNKSEIIKNLISETINEYEDKIVTQKRKINESSQRVEKNIIIHYKQTNEKKEFLESVRLYSEEELENLINDSGLVIFKKYGGFSGEALNSESPRQILFLEKAR